MRVSIIGCGLIGSRRADIIKQAGTDSITAVVDTDIERAKALASKIGCNAEIDWQSVVKDSAVDVVVVSTTNNWLAQITTTALQNGKNVLCEKPMGRNLADAEAMYKASVSSGKLLKIGFNHRYHPAIFKGYELCAEGKIGKLFYARSFYGHGGRPGYESEWRGNAELSGGGELLDQGVHVIDLFGWFLGDFAKAFGVTQTFQWFRQGTPVEDNAMATLTATGGQFAMFHTSWTQWKNRFSFEVFGEKGYIRVEGLGGSYGVERLTLGIRKAEGGAPIESEWEFAGPDPSWEDEWKDFSLAIQQKRQPLGSAADGLKAMRVVDAVYRSSKLGTQVDISK